MGCLVAYIAHTKGRSPVGWFFIGFFTSCIGLVLVLVLPDEDHQRNLQSENRRLREKLRMDRTVADRRHRETEGRLRVHDVALGVDTSERTERLEEQPLAEVREDPHLGPNARFYGVNWHYALNAEEQGPVSFDELKDLWLDGIVDRESLVWNKHLSDWRTIEAVRDLEDELRA